MSELYQSYTPDWYVIRTHAIKVTEIITRAYCIINPFSMNNEEYTSWTKKKDKFMKSKEYSDLHVFVSNSCKDTVDCAKASSIFEAVYDAINPEYDKATFMQENTEKIVEFNAYVLSRCSQTDKDANLPPQLLAIKEHLDCIDLTLDAFDISGDKLPEQLCIVKSHLKCAEILLNELRGYIVPSLY